MFTYLSRLKPTGLFGFNRTNAPMAAAEGALHVAPQQALVGALSGGPAYHPHSDPGPQQRAERLDQRHYP